jgi:RNA polymerase sigma-70 factor (ECF subfamily)
LEEKRDNKVAGEVNRAETELVGRARGGDKAAYGELVKMHQRRLLRTIAGMTGDLDSAMDIVQEGFVRAYQALDRFEPGQPFYPWISRIAVNLAINKIKRSARQTGLDAVAETRPDPGPDPLAVLQSKESDRRFMAAVRELPVPYREVFVLRQFEELEYGEIARRLHISPGTVDSRLFRARRLLVDKLRDLLS